MYKYTGIIMLTIFFTLLAVLFLTYYVFPIHEGFATNETTPCKTNKDCGTSFCSKGVCK
jgi:hypothetical protein